MTGSSYTAAEIVELVSTWHRHCRNPAIIRRLNDEYGYYMMVVGLLQADDAKPNENTLRLLQARLEEVRRIFAGEDPTPDPNVCSGCGRPRLDIDVHKECNVTFPARKSRIRGLPVIYKREQLVALAKELGVRHDWHEPTEQDVTIEFVEGHSFDNAMCDDSEYDGKPHEHFVIVRKEKTPVALVNMAMLFAWATGFENDG